jgi:F-type H+-transporting ATPase subunit c
MRQFDLRNFRDLIERLEQTVVVEEEEKGCGRAAKARATRRNVLMVRKLSTVMGTVAMLVLASPLLAIAQEGAGGGHAGAAGFIAIAANIGIGIAAFGSALGQGRVGAAAMESIGRNPNSTGQLFTPMIIALAFIEALTLYAFVVAFLLQGKI